jgi:hypothetical protein
MKKPLVFFLLCIHIAGNTEAGQVFRLPLLLKHFQAHQQQDPSLHFIDFLAMHYAGDDGDASDDADDAKLPFHDYTHSSVSAVYAPMVKTLAFIPFFTAYNDFPIEKKEAMPSKHVSILLQPPRSL